MFLSIDIGGTNIQFAKMNKENIISEHWELKTPTLETTKEFYDFIYDHAKPESVYLGVGVSVPGVVLENGLIVSKASSKLRPLTNSNIQKELNQRFKIPVGALNDGKAAALCELHLGSAKGSLSSICFIIGTNIGGGITYKDEVILGRDGFAGEFSTMPIHYDGEMIQLTHLASALALINHYNKRSNDKVDEAKEVFDRYHQKEQIAIDAINEWITWIAYAFRQLAVVYNPDVICIGGGVSNDAILLPLLKHAYKEALSDISGAVSITTELKLCSAPSHANLHGAILHLFNTYGV